MQIVVGWNISKNLSFQQNVKKQTKKITSDILAMVSKPINHFHWSFLQVLGLVTPVSFDLNEWKFCFVSMNVVVGRKTIIKTLTTWGQSSVIVWPTFPSRGFKHGQMWWKSFFTIGLIFEPMEIMLTVHVTQGPHHKCWHMLHVYFTSWKNLYGPN